MTRPVPLALGAALALTLLGASRAQLPDPVAPVREAGEMAQDWMPLSKP